MQFGAKPLASTSVFNKANPETAESDQIIVETTSIPEDITAFYDKIDKEDEDEEEYQELKTVSFEVNQVHTHTYIYKNLCIEYILTQNVNLYKTF